MSFSEPVHIAVLGLNHRTAPVELRERLAFPQERVTEALVRVKRELGILECVVLSTCNRVELYCALPEVNGHQQLLAEFVHRFHGLEPHIMPDPWYWYLQPHSVTHLFRVAAGLDSMVLGEAEILGQVKEAYQRAAEAETVGRVFRGLFQYAFSAAKDVRTKTQIGRGAVSVSSVAVELARKIFADLGNKPILILGAGQMGEATVRCLVGRGARRVLVVNRSHEAAQALARGVGGQPVPVEGLPEALRVADILICSTAADHYLLTRAQVQALMRRRRQRPFFLIDISVPRNLDPTIGTLDNVYLYNIDDLQGIAAANLQRRSDEMQTCLALIQIRTERFMQWLPRAVPAAPSCRQVVG